MRTQGWTLRSARLAPWLGFVLVLGVGQVVAGGEATAPTPARSSIAEGEELFFREWMSGDARSHGGDGLGPVFNDSSCIACHNAGAAGGAGPASKNVDVLSAFLSRADGGPAPPPSFLRRAVQALVGIDPPAPPPPVAAPLKPDTAPLVKAHAGFRAARSIVLHKFATDPDYENWRLSMILGGQFPGPFGTATGVEQAKTFALVDDNARQSQSQIGVFTLVRSQRNPTALFGAGLIDAIPEDVLEDAAKANHPESPRVSGRVSRQKDGRIGRFGWKGQTPSLEDFVLTACAVELGLEVPGHHQGGLPQAPEARAKGLDLNEPECNALIAYVRALPKPIERLDSVPAIAAGKESFERVGCAACHVPKLGAVEGIYSDLLLHDMGPELGDTGSYGVFVPDSSEPDFKDSITPTAETALAPMVLEAVVVEDSARGALNGNSSTQPTPAKPPTGPATRLEWRTPPLWGVRDSGPYLHDGRSATLENAIALHGGEAELSARMYFQLKPAERLQVQAFLKSLVAPAGPLARAGR